MAKYQYLLISLILIIPLTQATPYNAYQANAIDWQLTCYDETPDCNWFQIKTDSTGTYWIINRTAGTPNATRSWVISNISAPNIRHWDDFGIIVRYYFDSTTVPNLRFPPQLLPHNSTLDTYDWFIAHQAGHYQFQKGGATHYFRGLDNYLIKQDTNPLIFYYDHLTYVSTTDNHYYQYGREVASYDSETSYNLADYTLTEQFTDFREPRGVYPDMRWALTDGRINIFFYQPNVVSFGMNESMVKIYNISTFQVNKKKNHMQIQNGGYLEIKQEGNVFIKSANNFIETLFTEDAILFWVLIGTLGLALYLKRDKL